MNVYRLSFWEMSRGEVNDEWERYFSTLEGAKNAAAEHFKSELDWKEDTVSRDWEARPKARYETHYNIYEIEVEV